MAKRRDYDRLDRVNQQLLEVISGAMLTEVRDPRVQSVQITAVEASPDLRHAQVYYVLLEGLDGETDPRRVADGLERISGFLRSQVGKRTRLKHTPQLEFRYDESIEHGRRIESLLAELPEGEDQ